MTKMYFAKGTTKVTVPADATGYTGGNQESTVTFFRGTEPISSFKSVPDGDHGYRPDLVALPPHAYGLKIWEITVLCGEQPQRPPPTEAELAQYRAKIADAAAARRQLLG